MLNRRDFLEVAVALAALGGPTGRAWARTWAGGRAAGQDDLLAFEPVGNVTLLHVADIHGQLLPLYCREPIVDPRVGEAAGLPPQLTGRALLERYGIEPGSPEAYALTPDDFVALARDFGPVGGMDRIATLVNAIRAERPGRTLLLDGGDSLQGSYGALVTRGGDMARALGALGVEATTGHWEFTYGAARIPELEAELGCPFLAGNVRDTTWEEEVFPATATFERGGVPIAVIGQAFPYTPIANPRWLVPEWSFGIRERELAARVEAVRGQGAELVVLLSHNGFDVDVKLASRVPGIDVILTAHPHDALPAPLQVGGTLLVASGSHGKFLSRLDLDVAGGRVRDWRYRLIPVLADAIAPDPAMAAVVSGLRAPHEAVTGRVVGRTVGPLYRRGNFNGTWDDLICRALIEERDAEIALSPGFRWGPVLLPGQDVTVGDVYDQTAITYPAAYRVGMTGRQLRAILEDVADNLFNPDPYYRQGGDMVRVGGMTYEIDPRRPPGRRVGAMTLARTGEAVEADRSYAVAGWASVNEDVEGPPIHDVVIGHFERHGDVEVPEPASVRLRGAG